MGLFSALFNPGEQWGTNGMIGSALNNITGQSSSARQQYQYNTKLQKDAQEFAKWQMYNSHQAEVEDLQKAGLNPVLSAGGQGATAGGVGGGSTGAGTGIDPIGMIGSIFNMLNTAKQTNATVDKIQNEIANETALTKANVGHINAETALTNTTNKNQSTRTTAGENAEKLAKTWWGRNVSPILADIGQIFGGAGSAAINAATSARNANVMSNAIKNTPHTHVHYH